MNLLDVVEGGGDLVRLPGFFFFPRPRPTPYAAPVILLRTSAGMGQ